MAPLKKTSQSVVRCSSQDIVHRADNILLTGKKWLSNKTERSGRIEVEIHLDQATKIAFINIGNAGSAFIEIFVGQSMWQPGKEFVSFLPSTMLMSPADSKTNKNPETIKMLNLASFFKDAASEQWDRVRIICIQPFNKDKQFGLQFIEIVPDDRPAGSETKTEKSSASPTPSLSQFRSMLSPSRKPSEIRFPSGGLLSPSAPSRGAGLVQAALMKGSPVHRSNSCNRKKRTAPYPAQGKGRRRSPSDFVDEVECFFEGFQLKDVDESYTFRDLKEKLEQLRGVALSKAEAKVFMKMAKKFVNQESNDAEVVEQPYAPCNSSPETSTASSPESSTAASSADDCMVECPICGEFFRSSSIEMHASTCVADTTQHEVDNVPCPICHKEFPSSQINVHVNVCAEMKFVRTSISYNVKIPVQRGHPPSSIQIQTPF